MVSQSNSWIWRRCCTRRFLFKSYSLPQLVTLFFACCLLSSFANVDVPHSVLFVLVFSDVTARCVRMSNRHLLIISVPGFHWHIAKLELSRALFLSLTRSVSAILSCMHSSLLFPSKFSQWSFWFSLGIRRHVALSLFHAMQALHTLDSLQCVHDLGYPQKRRRIFWVQPLALFQPQSLAMEVHLLLCQLWPHRPSQFVDSQASLSVSLVQLLPRTTPFLVMHKTVPDPSGWPTKSHAACKRTDTVFSNFTKSNFLSKLRHWLSPSSTSSSHFTRLSVFAHSHFVRDFRCKTRKPTDQWTVICDAQTCVLSS